MVGHEVTVPIMQGGIGGRILVSLQTGEVMHSHGTITQKLQDGKLDKHLKPVLL